jgi:hypothetical protein
MWKKDDVIKPFVFICPACFRVWLPIFIQCELQFAREQEFSPEGVWNFRSKHYKVKFLKCPDTKCVSDHFPMDDFLKTRIWLPNLI